MKRKIILSLTIAIICSIGTKAANIVRLTTAENNTTQFDDITSAINAAKASSGSTLTLLSNCGNNELVIDFENKVLDMSIDLNGHKLTVKNIKVSGNGSSLTINSSTNGGELLGHYSGGNVINIAENSTLTIESGAISTALAWECITNHGTLNFLGGKILNTEDFGICIHNYSKTNITKGVTADGTYTLYNNEGIITINGGTFNGFVHNEGVINVNGGYYSTDPSEDVTITDGYKMSKITDATNPMNGYYALEKQNAVAIIISSEGVSKEYYDMKKALDAAKSQKRSIIKLTKSFSDEEFVINYLSECFDLTLDLNGYEFSCGYIDITGTGSNLTIKSSAKGGVLHVNNDVIYVGSGNTLTLESGTIATNKIYYCIYNEGTTHLNGGEIKGECAIRNNDETATLIINEGVSIDAEYGIYNAYGTIIMNGGNIKCNNIGIENNEGTVKINGGTLTAEYEAINSEGGLLTIEDGVTAIGGTYGVLIHGDNTTTINGGTFIGSIGLYQYDGVATINGGKFTGDEGGYVRHDGEVRLYGGYFSTNPTEGENVNTIPEGYILKKIEDGSELDGCYALIKDGETVANETETKKVEVVRYDINGKILNSTIKGTNIIKYNNGCVEKILVR